MAQPVTDPFQEALTAERSKPNFTDFKALEAARHLTAGKREILAKDMTRFMFDRYVKTAYVFGVAEVAVRCAELYSRVTVMKGTISGDQPFTHADVDIFAVATMQALAQFHDDPLAAQARDFLLVNRRTSLNHSASQPTPFDPYLQMVDEQGSELLK